MNQRLIVFHLNMKDLLLVNIQRNHLKTFRPEAITYSTMIKYLWAQSFREPNERNEIQDQEQLIGEVNGVILKTLCQWVFSFNVKISM
jgi:hypothetical protein